MALSLDAPRQNQRISRVSGEKKRQNGLSGLLDRIPRPEFRNKKSKRSLSRSKSAALGMDKKKSASSLLSLSSFDRPVSLTGLNEHMSHSHATKDSSEDGDAPVLPTYAPIDDAATGIYSSTFNTDTASMTLAEKVKNREENLSVLRDSVLEEFEKFSEFCSEFGEKFSGTSRGSIVTDCSELEHGARITQGENLI